MNNPHPPSTDVGPSEAAHKAASGERSDTMPDADRLDQLAAELKARGWKAKRYGDVLAVTNPDAVHLQELTYSGGDFRWPWRAPVGLGDEVSAVADRVMYVLRSDDGRGRR